MDERLLAERLIAYDTSEPEGVRLAAGFVKGWLEARDVEAFQFDVRDLPVTVAEVGPTDAVTVTLHGHLDVVPALPDQFVPRVEGGRLLGRGAYDMKGAVAAMMLALTDARGQDRIRVRLALVPDEESEELDDRGSDALVDRGYAGDFGITGEPTDMHIGIEAKGVLAMRIEVAGRAAHGSTPWLGDNAILKALDVFRNIESLPFTRQSSELFDRPSVNLSRVFGGDALNKVPDKCVIDVDVRYLPEQEAEAILEQVSKLPDATVISTFQRDPTRVERDSVFVDALCDAAAPNHDADVLSVGRDGASDAASFIRVGVPAVEFGPVGGGHHGPAEWVSVTSLANYRRALGDFIEMLPDRLDSAGPK